MKNLHENLIDFEFRKSGLNLLAYVLFLCRLLQSL